MKVKLLQDQLLGRRHTGVIEQPHLSAGRFLFKHSELCCHMKLSSPTNGCEVKSLLMFAQYSSSAARLLPAADKSFHHVRSSAESQKQLHRIKKHVGDKREETSPRASEAASV